MAQEHNHSEADFTNLSRHDDWFDQHQSFSNHLTTVLKHISRDGTELTPPTVTPDTVAPADSPWADITAYGATGSGDDGQAIQDAVNNAANGAVCIPPGEWVTQQAISTTGVDNLSIVFFGTLRLDDQGDDTINAPLFINSENVTLINPQIDDDRANNTIGTNGTQACIWFGSSASNVTVHGGKLTNARQSFVAIDNSSGIRLYGTAGNSAGEHATYVTGANQIKMLHPEWINPGQNVRSDGLKFRTCTDVSVVGSRVEYTGSESVDTIGTRVESGSENVDVEVTVSNADYGCRVSGTDSNGNVNDNIQIDLTAVSCGNATVGMTDMGDVKLTNVFCDGTSLSTRGVPKIGTATVRESPVTVTGSRTTIDHLMYESSGNGYLSVEQDGELILKSADIDISGHNYAVDVINDVSTNHLTLKNGAVSGGSTNSVRLQTDDNAIVDCTLSNAVDDQGTNNLVRHTR